MQPNHLTQIKRLTQTLLISGGLNIFLFALLFYFLAKETPPRPYFELKPAGKTEQLTPLALDSTNKELIRYYRSLTLEQLLAKLDDTQLVENGYTQRDLALASLVAFHHFDLSRALLGKAQPSQQRKIAFGRNSKGAPVEIVIYPGLTEQQHQAIAQFAKTERWPLTSRGLYLLLRKQGDRYESSLADTFFLTPEFLAVETLFTRSEVPVNKQDILKLLLQGNWKLISTFAEQQKTIQDLSPARRQRFLLDYIENQSTEAAYLLLKTDPVFAASKLDDAHTLTILNLLKDKTKSAEKFSIRLLTSPRSDAVLQMAAAKLYEFEGEPLPEKDLHHEALKRFVPQTASVLATKPVKSTKNVVKASTVKKPATTLVTTPTKTVTVKEAAKVTKALATIKPRLYVVQEGDSLWKISRKFKVEIASIKKLNNLHSDFLKPGTSLKIP